LEDPEDVVNNTVGRPLSPADEIRVVDEEDRDVPAGAIGELLTRGPYTLRGYYKAPEHNALVFTSDGFLRTGDLICVMADGNIVVQGRRKDVINRGGEKIVPAEVEDLLLEHPNVREVAVVAMPDAIMGEKICAFVIPREQALELVELREFLRGRGLADFKLPDRLKNVDSFPRTNVGKVDKVKLRHMVTP
jgi:2,3-dihydroxybenzoate-AMP ligase